MAQQLCLCTRTSGTTYEARRISTWSSVVLGFMSMMGIPASEASVWLKTYVLCGLSRSGLAFLLVGDLSDEVTEEPLQCRNGGKVARRHDHFCGGYLDSKHTVHRPRRLSGFGMSVCFGVKFLARSKQFPKLQGSSLLDRIHRSQPPTRLPLASKQTYAPTIIFQRF